VSITGRNGAVTLVMNLLVIAYRMAFLERGTNQPGVWPHQAPFSSDGLLFTPAELHAASAGVRTRSGPFLPSCGRGPEVCEDLLYKDQAVTCIRTDAYSPHQL